MTQLFCRESGHGNGESILFLHGGGVSSRMWERELDAHRNRHCLAPDLPGHGESAHLQPFTLEASVEALALLLRRRAHNGRASVVAFSVGAVVALALAARYPALVDRLLISGATPPIGPVARFASALLTRPLLTLLRGAQRAQLVALSLGLSQAQIGHFRTDLDRLTPDLVNAINAVVAYQEPLPMTSTPALILVGANELRSVHRRARQLVAASPHRQGFVVGPNAGHAWHLQAPDLFDDLLHAWLSNTPLPSRLEPLPL
jgi:pimeloyl-ACP methyl ester carboxylesterase